MKAMENSSRKSDVVLSPAHFPGLLMAAQPLTHSRHRIVETVHHVNFDNGDGFLARISSTMSMARCQRNDLLPLITLTIRRSRAETYHFPHRPKSLF